MMTLLLPSQAGAPTGGTGQVYFDGLPTRTAWGIRLSESPDVSEYRRRFMGPLVVTLGDHEWRQVGHHDFADEVGLKPGQVLADSFQHALRALADVEPSEGDDLRGDVWESMLPYLRAVYPTAPVAEREEWELNGEWEDGRDERRGGQQTIEAIFAEIERGQFSFTRGETATYTVAVAVESDDLLDWDLPLSGQSASVQACLHHSGLLDRLQDGIDRELITGSPKLGDLTGGHIYGLLVSLEDWRQGDEGRTDQQAASRSLLAAGIPGLRMLDHLSRRDEGWKPGMPVTREVIIFDPEKVAATHRNGEALTEKQGRAVMEDVQMETGVMPDVSIYLSDEFLGSEPENLSNSHF